MASQAQGQIVQTNQPQVAQQSTGPSVDAIRWAMQDPDRAAKLIEEYETGQEALIEQQEVQKASLAETTSKLGEIQGSLFFKEQYDAGVDPKDIPTLASGRLTDIQKAMFEGIEIENVTADQFKNTYYEQAMGGTKDDRAAYLKHVGGLQSKKLKELGLVSGKYEKLIGNLQKINEVRTDTFIDVQLDVDEFTERDGQPFYSGGEEGTPLGDDFSNIIGDLLENGVSREEQKRLKDIFKKFRKRLRDKEGKVVMGAGGNAIFPNVNIDAIKQSGIYRSSGTYSFTSFAGQVIEEVVSVKGEVGEDVVTYLNFLEKLLKSGVKRLAAIPPMSGEEQDVLENITEAPTAEQLLKGSQQDDPLNLMQK